ncbi:hypothetical protein Tco_0651564 [Tanacetum coccineum]|uniref:Uncharacterized protein n=1 Tax=Tanacetum coccineum TaxID=301880 RepID=A0ABQ4WVB4_9ASTR
MVNTATTTSSIPVSVADLVTIAGEVVTTASVEILEELTLAQTLIEIKCAKPKAVTTATTTVTPASSRPKAKGIAKYKGKAKMVKPEKPLKKKDQIAIDEEVARNLEAQLQAELEEKERLSRQKEEEALWKLVKAKHGNTRPEEAYERLLWGDLKIMFEPDVESEIWRNLKGYRVTVWKLFSSCGVHFVRFQNMHIFMLVKKKYPLTPATITVMLNKKLQTDYWNEMWRIVGIKRLLGVNTAKVRVTDVSNMLISVAYTKVNAARMKVTTAERLQLLEEFLLSKG